jgi:hypothetical protein
MVSRTDTRIARMIRAATHFPYNHISVTLDPTFSRWYSFARYHRDAPLYGGFVEESPERLLGEQKDAPVRIFRTEIPERAAADLEALLPLAGCPDSGLIYNHLDILACAVGLRVPVPGCHTCLSFAEYILNREFHSIEKLCQVLAPCQIYEGPLSGLDHSPAGEEDAYFVPMGWMRGSGLSAALLCRLLYRTLCHGFECYKAHFFRKTAL